MSTMTGRWSLVKSTRAADQLERERERLGDSRLAEDEAILAALLTRLQAQDPAKAHRRALRKRAQAIIRLETSMGALAPWVGDADIDDPSPGCISTATRRITASVGARRTRRAGPRPTLSPSWNMPLLALITEISQHPVLLVAGKNAHSRYFSEASVPRREN